MFPLYPPEDNRNYTCFLGFSDGVGFEHLPEMGHSLTWFMECRDFLVYVLDNANTSAGFLQTCVDYLRVHAVETLTYILCIASL